MRVTGMTIGGTAAVSELLERRRGDRRARRARRAARGLRRDGHRDRGPRLPGRGRVAHVGDDRRASACASSSTPPTAPASASPRPARSTTTSSTPCSPTRATTRGSRRPTTFVAFAEPDGVDAAGLELEDPSLASVPTDRKIALAIELERAARAGGRAGPPDRRGVLRRRHRRVRARVDDRHPLERPALDVVALGRRDRQRARAGTRRATRARPPAVSTASTSRRPRATPSSARRGCSGRPSPARRTARSSSTRGSPPRCSPSSSSALSGESVTKGRSFFAERDGRDRRRPHRDAGRRPDRPAPPLVEPGRRRGTGVPAQRPDRRRACSGVRLRHGLGAPRGHRVDRLGGPWRLRRHAVGGLPGARARTRASSTSTASSPQVGEGVYVQSRDRGALGGEHDLG